MSWAANNVEAYEEICIAGIIAKINPEVTEQSSLEWALGEIAAGCPDAFAELCAWANTEIGSSMADHLVGGEY